MLRTRRRRRPRGSRPARICSRSSSRLAPSATGGQGQRTLRRMWRRRGTTRRQRPPRSTRRRTARAHQRPAAQRWRRCCASRWRSPTFCAQGFARWRLRPPPATSAPRPRSVTPLRISRRRAARRRRRRPSCAPTSHSARRRGPRGSARWLPRGRHSRWPLARWRSCGCSCAASSCSSVRARRGLQA
ncbi:hypothetical protein T492DRAFT_1045883 [Pavlovales sp. CCMP2436]|nr:hypothetical protein T492DRAFT_1045883 [Pavlovales sp. CCMP2436]